MAFPKLNMLSYWVYFVGGVTMLASFFQKGGAAQSGWTSYPPLAVINDGQTMWLIGMIFLITSSLLGSINFIVTIVQLRAKGLSYMRLPVLRVGAVRHVIPVAARVSSARGGGRVAVDGPRRRHELLHAERLVVSGRALTISGNGNPLLWQHLFWFLAHPEVYVLILPAMGIVGRDHREQHAQAAVGLQGARYSVTFLGFMSFIVWAHHMFMTGMGTTMSAFFQTTTMIISIPSVVILTALLLSLWGASIRFTTPMLFALAFPADVRHRRTHRPAARSGAVRHPPARHLLRHRPLPLRRAPGTIFALFAGVYYWFPKATDGR
jgi:cytochrome c oxidase subunit 1